MLQLQQSQGVSLGAPQQLSQSEDWISPAFGGELAARPVSLRERISGTPQPTGDTLEPFYTAFRVEFCVAKLRYSTHLYQFSIHSAGVFKSAAGNSSIPIGQPAYLRSIRSRNN